MSCPGCVFEKGAHFAMSKKQWGKPVVRTVDAKAATQGNGNRQIPGDKCSYQLEDPVYCVSGT